MEEFVATAAEIAIEELWNGTKSKLHKLCDEFVPKKKSSSEPSWKNVGTFPISGDVQQAIKEKQASHRQWMASLHRGDPELAK